MNPGTAHAAQVFNLLYRRLATGRAADTRQRVEPAHASQNEILRYSRVQLCATANRA